MTETPNLNYINDLAAGSQEFKDKLIGIVKREFPDEKEVFLENFDKKNYIKAAENVHKLKHKVGMMGFVDGYQVTVDFEEELRKGESEGYSKFMCILESIEQFLKTI